MATYAESQRIKVLDDFVCEAIPSAGTCMEAANQTGRNSGMSVLEEILFDASIVSDTIPTPPTLRITDVAQPVANCKRCESSKMVYRLNCCQTCICRACLMGMINSVPKDGAQSHCEFCGHLYTEAISA